MKSIDKLKLLVICSRAFDERYDKPISEHVGWFSAALGLDANQIKVVYVADEGYPDPTEFDGIIISGSTYSAYKRRPWTSALEQYIRLVYKKNVPMLGICFGHQIIAQAFDGLVELAGKGPEFGSTSVSLTSAGAQDKLFKGVDPNFDIVMVHEDIVVDPPVLPDFHVLASSETYLTQACAYGDHIRSVQFHPEYSASVFEMLVQRHRDLVLAHGWVDSPDDIPAILEKTRKADVGRAGHQILLNFRENFMRA